MYKRKRVSTPEMRRAGKVAYYDRLEHSHNIQAEAVFRRRPYHMEHGKGEEHESDIKDLAGMPVGNAERM